MPLGTPTPSKPPVTLAHVAAIARVSPKTVSRVINRDTNVSPATKARVEAAIMETGYVVNLAARSLAASRSYLIGMFMPNMSSHYCAEIFRGAARACRQHGFHLVVEEYDFGAATVVDRYEYGLRSTRCEALLLIPPVCDDMPLLEALDRDGVRYVCISPGRHDDRTTAIFADDSQGVASLARHLWDRGCRRFGLIAGPSSHASAAIRETAFTDTLKGLGASPDDITMARPDWNGTIAEVGRKAALSLLSGPQARPEAIFAFNDEAAIGAITCARDLGLNIPGDVAIAGFDDSYMAQLVWPQLTTVHQPIAEIAIKAIQVIAEEQPAEHRRIYMPTHLVVRDSA